VNDVLSIYLILPTAVDPGAYSVSSRNEQRAASA
jgi:hypothetical protein